MCECLCVWAEGVTYPSGSQWKKLVEQKAQVCPCRHHSLVTFLHPSCQVEAEQQNKVNHGQTWVFTFSANEGVLPCSEECVWLFEHPHSLVIHYACSQTSFRSWLRQNSGERLAAMRMCPCWCAHCLRVSVVHLLSKALLALWRLLSPAAVCQGDSNWLNLPLPTWCKKHKCFRRFTLTFLCCFYNCYVHWCWKACKYLKTGNSTQLTTVCSRRMPCTEAKTAQISRSKRDLCHYKRDFTSDVKCF